MPLITGRGEMGYSDVQQYSITDNPVFQVKVRSLATPYEQKAKNTKSTESDDKTKEFKIGDLVMGKGLEDSKDYQGFIVDIKEDESKITIKDDKKGKRIDLDVTTCKKMYKNSKSKEAEETDITFEGLMTFKDFVKYKVNESIRGESIRGNFQVGERILVSNKKIRIDGTIEKVTDKAVKITGSDSFGSYLHDYSFEIWIPISVLNKSQIIDQYGTDEYILPYWFDANLKKWKIG